MTLEIPAGSFFALLGASGSGKTTLLKLLGGYLLPGQGRILVGGQDVTTLPPERRQMGMVFQSYALFPHLSARGNVAFGLEVRGLPRAERVRRVEEVLDRVALPPDLRDRKPAALSGGQQQRVALARALVIDPDLLLLDEPLANLDRQLRQQVRGELRALQRRTGVTTLLVTHDQEEALALADCIGIMAHGRLLQVGTPQDVYQRPCCPYVARLLGEANLLTVDQVSAEQIVLSGLPLAPAPATLRTATPGDVVLVRPEQVRVDVPHWEGEVRDLVYQGSHVLTELQIGPARLLASLTVPNLARGARVPVGIPAEAFHILPDPDPFEEGP